MMPDVQIPVEEIHSTDTSLESSNGNVPSGRSTSSSDDIYIRGDVYPDQIFNEQTTIRLAQMTPQRYQYEPKLDDLLRQVSGNANLETLKDIQLRVVSNMVGLHRLNIFLPSLVSLNLDGSSLHSLRDLGCDLTVQYLNVSRCCLRNFDGINGLRMVQHLVADYNEIHEMNQLNTLSHLEKLSLRGNRVKELGAVSFLIFCPNLKDLDLSNNPISKISNYRSRIKEVVPDLQILDSHVLIGNPSKDVNDTDATSSSDFNSSFTSSSKPDTSHTSNELRIDFDPKVQRASSLCEMPDQRNEIIAPDDRPATAEPYRKKSSLSTGAPICGNVISKVRRQKQRAWLSSRSSSSILSENSTEIDVMTTDVSHMSLQSPVELELGVIGMPNTSKENIENQVSVLSAAREWRRRNKKNRRRIDKF